MVDKFTSILTTIVILAIVTTLVLPGRQTASVASAGFKGFADSIRAGLGN